MDVLNMGELLKTFGWGGVILFAVWLVFTGRLIPKSVVDRVLLQAAEETQRWRTAFEQSEAARSKDRETTMKALESTQTTASVMRAFNEVVSQSKEEGTS